MKNTFTLVVYNNSLQRNHFVGNFRTFENAIKKATFFVEDGISGCNFKINGQYLAAEDLGITKDSPQYRKNFFA